MNSLLKIFNYKLANNGSMSQNTLEHILYDIIDYLPHKIVVFYLHKIDYLALGWRVSVIRFGETRLVIS